MTAFAGGEMTNKKDGAPALNVADIWLEVRDE